MTLRRRIVACLDVDGGRTVKGTRFVELRDVGDPVELAARHEADGADEIVLLDITASHLGRDTLLEVVRRAAEQLFVPLTVGGGVREAADVGRLLRAGADKVSINTAAVERPGLLREAADRYGSQCVVASIDARQTGPGSWTVVTRGGRVETGLDPGVDPRDPATGCPHADGLGDLLEHLGARGGDRVEADRPRADLSRSRGDPQSRRPPARNRRNVFNRRSRGRDRAPRAV